MISIEKLKKVTVCYVHAHCPDGLASAMILKDAFRMLGMSPRIEFLMHGTREHAVASSRKISDPPGIHLWCDIVPTQAADKYDWKLAIALDHHKGAEAVVRSFGENSVFADEKLEPGVSGAVLAFREVWQVVMDDYDDGALRNTAAFLAVKEFAAAIGARDTWQTQSPLFQCGQWISKMLMSKPASHWLDAPAIAHHVPHPPYLFDDEIAVGRALYEAHEEAVRQAVEQCVEFDVNRTLLCVFQEQASGFRLCSDVAEALRRKAEAACLSSLPGVVAGFAYVVNKPGDLPVLVYSLRGLGGFNVAAFAKANGGGGHTAAAGFSVGAFPPTAPHPYLYIKDRLEEFLEKQ